MKSRLYFLILVLVGVAFSGCKKDKDSPDVSNNKYVNSWIKQNMNLYYLWNDKIPTNADKTQNPDKYFNSLLYKYNKTTAPDGDRFSWIQENYVDLLNSLSGVASNEIGFEYKLYGLSDNMVFGEIAYVKKGTDAASKGLKRGQAFTHVNGTALTISNYQSLLSNMTASSTVTLKFSDVSLDEDNNKINFLNSQDKTITLLSKYAENPVYLDTIYTIGGKNIGYLVYNFFAGDDGSNTNKSAYDLALNNVFGKFKNNISELILDLRYNNGGSLLSAIYLSSMITKNLNINNTFLKVEYNSAYQNFIIEKYGEDDLIDKFTNKINNIDLINLGNIQTLYVLTGNSTASASEMVINGLKPYMDVFLIGDTTVGKNVGSVSFYEENDPKNKWGMQPIIGKFYNSVGKSDFTAGFAPDIFDKDAWNMPKKALGDVNEALLKKAIAKITGAPIPAEISRKATRIEIKEISSSFDKKAWRNQTIIPANSLPKLP